MRISGARLTVHAQYPFRIARRGASVIGRDVHRVIVRVEHDGLCGYGEAAPTPYYEQSPDSVMATIKRVADDAVIAERDPFAIGPVVRRLTETCDDQRATVAAIDAAMHDWVGRRLGVPVWQLLGLDAADTPPTSMTIGLDEPGVIERKVIEAADFGALKIKVGVDSDERTLDIVRRLAPDKVLRLDANASWSPEIALDRINALARFAPELIEQPIPAGNHDALREIHRSSAVPIYADEDCVRPEDIPALAGCVSGVNVKLSKCGGIREALRAIELARSFDLRVMIGCMAETSLGVSAGVQLASLADVIDLDGHLLLEDDPFDALALDVDRVLPSDRPGLGAEAGELFA